MKFSLAKHPVPKTRSSYLICDDNIGFEIQHFSYNWLPFRHHWNSLIDTLSESDNPNDLKLIPFLFRYESKGSHLNNVKRIDWATKKFLETNFPEADSNHVVVQVGDHWKTIPYLQKFHIFQESLKSENKHALPVHFISEFKTSTDILDCKNLLFFQGTTATNPLRMQLVDALAKHPHCKIVITDRFFYLIDREERPDLKDQYQRGMENSKYILCPKGWGQNSIRFFEALACGRIPVLISDDLQLVRPDIIPYNDIIIRVPEKDAANVMNYLVLPDGELERRSKLAKKIYQKYFAEKQFVKFLESSLRESPKQISLIQKTLHQKHSALIITNSCNKNCGGCHQLCGHWSKSWFINKNDFRTSIECLIEHYKLRETTRRHINVYGGEPTLHPEWNDLIEIMYNYPEYPFVVFTNGINFKEFPQTGDSKFLDIFQEFAGHHKNVAYRLDEHLGHFAATLVAPCDVLKRGDYWALAQNHCHMWRHCEMVIYQNKGYICAPGAAIDHMFYGGKHGWPTDPGQPPFEKSDPAIIEQATMLCRRCRFAMGFNVPLIPKQEIKEKTLATLTNYNFMMSKPKLNLIKIQDTEGPREIPLL